MVLKHPGAWSPGARHGSLGRVPVCTPGAWSPGARHGPHASRGTGPGGEAWSSCIPGHGPRVRGMVLKHPGARSPGARHGPLGRVPACTPGAWSPGARHGPHASRGTVPGCEAWSSMAVSYRTVGWAGPSGLRLRRLSGRRPRLQSRFSAVGDRDAPHASGTRVHPNWKCWRCESLVGDGPCRA